LPACVVARRVVRQVVGRVGMKLDVELLRYLEADELRMLHAVEVGMRNHEYVPTRMLSSSELAIHPRLSACVSQLAQVSSRCMSSLPARPPACAHSLTCTCFARTRACHTHAVAGLRRGGAHKVLKDLVRHKLLGYDNKKCEAMRFSLCCMHGQPTCVLSTPRPPPTSTTHSCRAMGCRALS
jgi:hypothetical protein